MEHGILGHANTQKVEAGGRTRSSKSASAKNANKLPQVCWQASPECTHRHTWTCAQRMKYTNINRASEPEGLSLGSRTCKPSLLELCSRSIPSLSGLQMTVHIGMGAELSTPPHPACLVRQESQGASPLPERGALKHQDVSRL